MREYREKNREKVREINRKNYWKNYEHNRKRARNVLIKLRESIFDILGHECVRCGFTDKRALQFDHINGGGNQEVKKFKASMKMLRYYRDNPEACKKNLQTLCANCNLIKYRED